MSKIIEGLLYSKDHEWIKVEGGEALLGVTDHAQESLGDVVFAEGEPEGARIEVGAAAGVVESVKAASDVFSPVAGVVLARNPALDSAPETINSDPYGAWIIRLKLDDGALPDDLMDAGAYRKFCEEEL